MRQTTYSTYLILGITGSLQSRETITDVPCNFPRSRPMHVRGASEDESSVPESVLGRRPDQHSSQISVLA